MCGIAGLVSFNDTVPEKDLLVRMLGFIGHRGPDAFGIYLDRNAGLAHARLSIIDLSGGDQPIHNEDRSIWVVYNGEAFNYPELRTKLENLGHKFYTKTDTETLVHLYEEYGAGMFVHLNGQFAVAIWDKNRRRLLLGRDRLGVRPLFYHRSPGGLIFGSEIKAIFADPHVPRALDFQSLSDVFTCWAPLGSATAFENIFQVPPGHYAIFSKTFFDIKPYWQLSFSNEGYEGRSLENWSEELHSLLYDATKIRLRADVPVGAYVSGGLDSTFITSLVKQSFDNEICTFSVGFAESRFNESDFQKQAVRSLGTDNRMIQCSNEDIGANFPKIVWHTEVPLLRTAPGPLFQLSRLVRESNFKVVLTGEGSDEIFAGYDIFKEDWVRRYWAQKPGSGIRAKLLHRLYPDIFSNGNRSAGVFLESFFRKSLMRQDSPAYSHLVRWENTAHLKTFLSAETHCRAGIDDDFLDRFTAGLPPDFMRWHPLSRAQHTEISIFLSNYLLSSQGDRVAMANAIEGRFPFLDHRVVEFAAKMPPHFRLCGLKDKLILRRIAKDYMPRDLATRPKQPYRAPVSQCFFGPQAPAYVSDFLAEKSIADSGIFNPSKVVSLIDKCRKKNGRLLSERDNMAVVGILSTQILHDKFIINFPAKPDFTPSNVKEFN